MKNSDFYDFGEQIQKVVQSAIDSNDFRELNKTVRETVNDAVGAVRSSVSQASENIAKTQNGNINRRRGENCRASDSSFSGKKSGLL